MESLGGDNQTQNLIHHLTASPQASQTLHPPPHEAARWGHSLGAKASESEAGQLCWAWWGWQKHPHFAEQNTEAWRGAASHPRPHSKMGGVEAGSEAWVWPRTGHQDFQKRAQGA